MVRTGTTRQEFVSAGDNWWQHRVLHKLMFMQWGQLTGGLTQQPRRYAADDRVTETWHAPVLRPAVPASGAPVPTRTGDNLELRVPEFVDAEGHYSVGREQRGVGHRRGPGQPGRAADRRPVRRLGVGAHHRAAAPATGWT